MSASNDEKLRRVDVDSALGPEDAFITTETLEFGHQHRPSDGSIHMLLPKAFSATALERAGA